MVGRIARGRGRGEEFNHEGHKVHEGGKREEGRGKREEGRGKREEETFGRGSGWVGRPCHNGSDPATTAY
jgi:hypothetical protein